MREETDVQRAQAEVQRLTERDEIMDKLEKLDKEEAELKQRLGELGYEAEAEKVRRDRQKQPQDRSTFVADAKA